MAEGNKNDEFVKEFHQAAANLQRLEEKRKESGMDKETWERVVLDTARAQAGLPSKKKQDTVNLIKGVGTLIFLLIIIGVVIFAVTRG